MKYVIFDLDGCLSDDRWRRKLIDRERLFFTAYHDACTKDEPINKRYVHEAVLKGYQLVIVTGRPISYLRQTEEWLKKHFRSFPFGFKILMRPEGNHDPAPALKTFLISQNLKWTDIVMAYDDRQDVLDAYRDKHLFNVAMLNPYGDVDSVSQILHHMAETFTDRNKVYRDNYLRVGPVMKALFGTDIPSELVVSDRWHLFELIVIKLTRFATSELSHTDSIHDIAIYAAMIEADIKRSEK